MQFQLQRTDLKRKFITNQDYDGLAKGRFGENEDSRDFHCLSPPPEPQIFKVCQKRKFQQDDEDMKSECLE